MLRFCYCLTCVMCINIPHSLTSITIIKSHKQKNNTLIVISDTSFESGLSEDYAIPPDAVSQADSTYMDASLPSILMRSSYVDSPNKKMESLEKVKRLLNQAEELNFNPITFCFHFISVGSPGEIRWKIEDMAQAMVRSKKWFVMLLEEST